MDRYDEDCIPPSFKDKALGYIQDDTTNKTCFRSLTVRSFCLLRKFLLLMLVSIFVCVLKESIAPLLQVPKQMKSPIYVYYQLSNFYQNHRRYRIQASLNSNLSYHYAQTLIVIFFAWSFLDMSRVGAMNNCEATEVSGKQPIVSPKH